MLPDFKLSVRANNQVTLTLQNSIKRDKRYENNVNKGRISKASITRFVRREAAKCDLNTYYSNSLKHECMATPSPNLLPLSLDLINRFQHAKKLQTREKLGYGKSPEIKYFSHRAGQKIRECGAIIDRLCGEKTDKCRVVTLTLPSSEKSAYKALSDYSGYATNRLFQIIRRDYSLAHWFYVWEHQKRGALHLHICVYHQDPKTSEEIGQKLCAKWRDILGDISEESGVDLLFSRGFNRKCELSDMQLDNQAMRLGCGAYFSKYASKNSGKFSDDINSINARKYPPSSFWGRSRELKRLCDEYSYSFKYEGIDEIESEALHSEALEILSQYKSVLSHSFAFKKEIEMERGNKESSLTICEGMSFVFYFSPKEIEEIRLKLKEHFDNYKQVRNLDLRQSLV